mgnify:CR=1 FL=1
MSVIKPEPGLPLKILRYPLTLLVLGFVAFTALYLAAGITAGQPRALHHSPLQPPVVLAFCALAVWLYRLF